MGGGSSTLLPQLGKQLNESSLDKFRELEMECLTRNLTPVEMYLFLSAKLEDLLEEDRCLSLLTLSERAKQQEALSQYKHSYEMPKEKNKIIIKKPVPNKPRPKWGMCGNAVNAALVKSNMGKSQSSVNIRGANLLSSISSESALEKSHEPELFVEDSLIQLGENDNIGLLPEPVEEVAHTALGNSVSCPVLPSVVAPVVPCSYKCDLCKKVFDTQNMLDTHFAHSQIHAKAVEERDAKYLQAFKHAAHLAELLKGSVAVMKNSRGRQMKRDYKHGEMTRIEYRWRHATNKVIDRCVKVQYENRLFNMMHNNKSSADSNKPVDTSIRLLYTGTKFFWRLRAGFHFHIYQHAGSDCMEIIPQLLPSGTAESVASSPAVPDRQSLLLRSTRIYLSVQLLKEQMAKHHAQAGSAIYTTSAHGVHETSAAPAASAPSTKTLETHHHHHHHDHSQRSPFDTGNYDTDSDSDGETEEKQDQYHADPQPANNAVDCDLLGGSMSLYILNHLNVDYVAVQNHKTPLHNAVFFDCNSVTLVDTPTPLLAHPPQGLRPVAVGHSKTFPQWEIQYKMKQLHDSQKSLVDAVQSAKVMSDRTETLMPGADKDRAFVTQPTDLFSPTKLGQTSRPASRRWTFMI